MKIYKEIEVDLDAERVRIHNNPDYTEEEKTGLLRILNLLNRGKFQQMADFINGGSIDLDDLKKEIREIYLDMELCDGKFLLHKIGG